MSLLLLILGIALFGVLLWAINKYLPMDSKIKVILNIVAVVALILWLLTQFGIINYLSRMKI
jgi:uncharacterized BrkB/YihY/UPF0761 family membrane protein